MSVTEDSCPPPHQNVEVYRFLRHQFITLNPPLSLIFKCNDYVQSPGLLDCFDPFPEVNGERFF